jgi:tripartite-type tricarboxylate transporter receptor subunit TctC
MNCAKTFTTHNETTHISRREALIMTVGALLSSGAMAQDFPQKAVQLVVPYSPGGLTDNIARIYANSLKDSWGQAVVIDNKPGAGATLGAAVAARANPDGHTFLLGSVGMVTNPFMFKTLPYKPTDLVPLALAATAPNVLYVHPSVPAMNVKELVDYAKKNPGALSFASSGQGSSPHLAAALFAAKAGIEVLHVPYKGTAQAITDLIGGQVKVYFDTMQSMPYAKDGKIRALAVTTEKRLAQAPDLPTVEESGVASGVFSSSWFGYFIHAKTPIAIQKKIAQNLINIGQDKEIQQKLATMGVIPSMLDSAGFEAFLKKETEKWGDVIRSLNIQLG